MDEAIVALKALLKDPKQTEAMRCHDCYADGGCVMVSLYDVIRELERIAAGEGCSMKSIRKYQLQPRMKQKIEMPEGAQILTVQTQVTSVCLWAMVNTKAPKEKRTIHIVSTDKNVDHIHDKGMTYIGTAQIELGNIVCHVFEE